MRLIDRLVARSDRAALATPESFYGAMPYFFQSYGDRKTEPMQATYRSYAQDGYSDNGIVFGLNYARLRYFSQARFKFRNLSDRKLFGSPELLLLERPWPNGTTGELLARMIQDVDLAGNAFIARRSDRLERLAPDCVAISLVEYTDPQGREFYDVGGYVYAEESQWTDPDALQVFDEPEVAHWSPLPDPLARFRGMSWLTPVVRDINNDKSMAEYQSAFFANNATPNMLIKFPQKLDPGSLARVRDQWNARHAGTGNAFKTAVLDMGADVTVIGASMKDSTYDVIRAKGETRIASAAGVPPIIAGFSEGLDAATYSNFAQAMRAFSDGTLAHLWQTAAASLSKLVNVPSGAELWVDRSDLDALRESEKDRAEAQHTLAVAAGELIRGGFDPASVFPALIANDYSLLKHTGGVPTALYPNGVAPNPSQSKG